MKLTVKTVPQGGSVMEVGCLFPQTCVRQVTIALAEQQMPINTSVLLVTNAQKAVQILCLVRQDITKMRQYRRLVESVHLVSTVMILMAQSSHMDSSSA